MMSPSLEERFDAVMEALSEIRPYLIAAGGDVKLVALDAGVVSVALVGAFATRCRLRRDVLKRVEETVKNRAHWVERVVAVCPPDGMEVQ